MINPVFQILRLESCADRAVELGIKNTGGKTNKQTRLSCCRIAQQHHLDVTDPELCYRTFNPVKALSVDI